MNTDTLIDGDKYELTTLTAAQWSGLRSMQRATVHLTRAVSHTTRGQQLADSLFSLFREAEHAGLCLATEFDEWMRLKGEQPNG